MKVATSCLSSWSEQRPHGSPVGQGSRRSGAAMGAVSLRLTKLGPVWAPKASELVASPSQMEQDAELG